MQLPLCFTFLALAALVAAEELRIDAQAECADGKCEPVLTTVYCTETETATTTTTMCETVYTTCVKMMTSIEISCPTVSPCAPPEEKLHCAPPEERSPCVQPEERTGAQPEERTVAQPEDQKRGSGDCNEASYRDTSMTEDDNEQQGGAVGMDEDADLRTNNQFLPGCRRRCLRWGEGGFCRRWNRRCRCSNWWGGMCRRWRPWGFGW